MTNYERIKAKVQDSSIEQNDKQIILDFFAEVSDENLVEIADLFEQKPEWVKIFNDNRKAKLKAFASGDESELNEILEQEKKYLNELTYGLD
ncbi:hypothetical protein KW782_00135 [Candidatus Parcubacteria bacterium]|nr:hypothetical protein [Candidatus Parcubacteria bacterium]